MPTSRRPAPLKILTCLSLCLPLLLTNPAPAASDDMTRALAALFGIALIGTMINDRQNNQTDYAAVPTRPLPKRVQRKQLPSQCLRQVDGFGGQTRMLSGRCLDRHYAFARNLPARCSLRIQGFDRVQRGYSLPCLRQHGYKVARS